MLNPLENRQAHFDDFSLMLLDESRGLRGTLFIYAGIITYFLLSLPLAFEGMMFVHAMTKGTVLGIDRQLRRTFGLAVLTGLGTMLFIIGCEVVEALLPLPGIAGGVFLSGGVMLVRRPILAIADGFSGKLLPSSIRPRRSHTSKHILRSWTTESFPRKNASSWPHLPNLGHHRCEGG